MAGTIGRCLDVRTYSVFSILYFSPPSAQEPRNKNLEGRRLPVLIIWYPEQIVV